MQNRHPCLKRKAVRARATRAAMKLARNGKKSKARKAARKVAKKAA